MRTVYLVTSVSRDDWTLFLTFGRNWSNERPDAEEFASHAEALAALKAYAAKRPVNWSDTGVTKDELDD